MPSPFISTVQLPRVALVGRANVGKSTVFNRLSEERRAIVSPMPGTTRDWNTASLEWNGVKFDLIDTGGMDQLGDTDLDRAIEHYATKAMETADVLVFVVDGKAGLLPEDRRIAAELRRSQKPIVVAVNKCDTQSLRQEASADFLNLGFEVMTAVSGANGSGSGDLLDHMVKQLKLRETTQTHKKETELIQGDTSTTDAPPLHIAIIGRPNVGKSSLLNAICGEDRALVSPVAGTTRDVNALDFTYKGQAISLLDTAGIRRRSSIARGNGTTLTAIERESVHAAFQAMNQADVIILVLDSSAELSDQDQRLAELALESRKGVIIALNKWDLVEEKTPATITQYTNYFSSRLPFLSWAPMVFISSVTYQRVTALLDLVLEVNSERKKTLTPEQCDDVLRYVERRYQPKVRQDMAHGKQRPLLKLNRMEQYGTIPPRFVIFCPKPRHVAPAIVNLIEKRLREQHEFLGTPLFLTVRAEAKHD